jgi:hypothetical protein
VFFDPRGGTHFEGRWEGPEGKAEEASDVSAERSVRDKGSKRPYPDTPRDPNPMVERLLAENRRRGLDPSTGTPSSRWKRAEDIPDEVLFRAGEALMG